MIYLLTFNCYGTRLPGDERGWVEKARGDHRGGYQNPNPALLGYCREVMAQQAYQLDSSRAQTVLAAIQEVCACRDWDLVAAHVRTTHVHLVLDRVRDPDRAIFDLKSYSSRALHRLGLETSNRKLWARGGSTRPLTTGDAIHPAITYVVDEQGEPMAFYLAR